MGISLCFFSRGIIKCFVCFLTINFLKGKYRPWTTRVGSFFLLRTGKPIRKFSVSYRSGQIRKRSKIPRHCSLLELLCLQYHKLYALLSFRGFRVHSNILKMPGSLAIETCLILYFVFIVFKIMCIIIKAFSTFKKIK